MSASALASHHAKMIEQCDQLSDTTAQTQAIVTLQRALDANLMRLTQANQTTQQAVASFGDDGLTEAMIVLARAVDVLAERIPSQASQPRRAA